jgi:hypothetical protein
MICISKEKPRMRCQTEEMEEGQRKDSGFGDEDG